MVVAGTAPMTSPLPPGTVHSTGESVVPPTPTGRSVVPGGSTMPLAPSGGSIVPPTPTSGIPYIQPNWPID